MKLYKDTFLSFVRIPRKWALSFLACGCLVVGGVGCTGYYLFQLYYEGEQVQPTPLARQLDPYLTRDNRPRATSEDADIPPYRPSQPPSCGHAGYLYLPRLDKKIPYVFGTSKTCLKKGIGLLTETDVLVYPGEKGRCILSGHRDTHFREARYLQEGDRLIVTYSEKPQKVFIYQYRTTQIVDQDDTSVVAEKSHPEMCLTTCYPFTYIGNAPRRYVMCGPLIAVMTVPLRLWLSLTLRTDET